MAVVYPTAERVVARHPGVRAELRSIRDRGAANARTLLAEHDQPGGSKITTSSGNVDYFWSLEDGDGGRGEPAAAAIEFGHHTKSGRFVEGLHVVERSAAAL